MKNRRVVRRNLLSEKKSIHRLEAEQVKLLDVVSFNTGVERPWRPVNFHRPANVVMWNMSKQAREHVMRAPSKSHIEYRNSENARDQLKEFSFEVDEELEMVSLVSSVRVAPSKYEIPEEKKRIRPGGRVERRMYQLEREQMIEDNRNAREFAKALCNMEIPECVIRQKEDSN